MPEISYRLPCFIDNSALVSLIGRRWTAQFPHVYLRMLQELSQDFYQNYDTLGLAQKLLGKELVYATLEGICSGIIVETEAYLHNDKACHAFGGITPRNRPMFGNAGTGYVYQIYGIHHCFNIVSGAEGKGEAVLIRALKPVKGIELMKQRRKREKINELCSGPGKLVQALGITKALNGELLTSQFLYVTHAETDFEIQVTTRIGIGKGRDEHLPYRFYIKNSEFISKP
jgi:DNA-3-methyladenine glycosylase